MFLMYQTLNAMGREIRVELAPGERIKSLRIEIGNITSEAYANLTYDWYAPEPMSGTSPADARE